MDWVPSVNPHAPLSFKRPNSVMSNPLAPLVKVAIGNILMIDLSLDLLLTKSNVETLSISGKVLGMVATPVTPPETAA